MQGLSGIRVLLVEDDVEVLKATRQLLEMWCCNQSWDQAFFKPGFYLEKWLSSRTDLFMLFIFNLFALTFAEYNSPLITEPLTKTPDRNLI